MLLVGRFRVRPGSGDASIAGSNLSGALNGATPGSKERPKLSEARNHHSSDRRRSSIKINAGNDKPPLAASPAPDAAQNNHSLSTSAVSTSDAGHSLSTSVSTAAPSTNSAAPGTAGTTAPQSSDSEHENPNRRNERIRHRHSHRRRARSPHGKREGSGSAKCDLPALLSLSSLIVSAPSTLTKLQLHLAGFDAISSPKQSDTPAGGVAAAFAAAAAATGSGEPVPAAAPAPKQKSPTKRRHNAHTNPTPGPMVSLVTDSNGQARYQALPTAPVSSAPQPTLPTNPAPAGRDTAGRDTRSDRAVIRHDRVEQLTNATKLSVIDNLRRARGMSGGGTGELKPSAEGTVNTSGRPVPSNSSGMRQHRPERASTEHTNTRDPFSHSNRGTESLGPQLLYQPGMEPGVSPLMSALAPPQDVWRGGVSESRHHDQHFYRPPTAALNRSVPPPSASPATGGSGAPNRLSKDKPFLTPPKMSSTSPFPLVQQTATQIAAHAAAHKLIKDDQLQTVQIRSQDERSPEPATTGSRRAEEMKLNADKNQKSSADKTLSKPANTTTSTTVNPAVDRIAKGRIQTTASAQIVATANANKAAAAAAAAQADKGITLSKSTPVTVSAPAQTAVQHSQSQSPGLKPIGQPKALNSPVVVAPPGGLSTTGGSIPSLTLGTSDKIAPTPTIPSLTGSVVPASTTSVIVTPKLLSMKRETSGSPVFIPTQTAHDTAAEAAAALAAQKAPAQTGPAGLSLTKQQSTSDSIPTVPVNGSSDTAPAPAPSGGGPSFLPVIHIPEQFSMSATPKHHLSLMPVMSDLNVPTIHENGGKIPGVPSAGPLRINQLHIPNLPAHMALENKTIQMTSVPGTESNPGSVLIPVVPYNEDEERAAADREYRDDHGGHHGTHHTTHMDQAALINAINNGMDLSALTNQNGPNANGNARVQLIPTTTVHDTSDGLPPGQPAFNQSESYSITNSGIVKLRGGFEVSRTGVHQSKPPGLTLGSGSANVNPAGTVTAAGGPPQLRRPLSEPEHHIPHHSEPADSSEPIIPVVPVSDSTTNSPTSSGQSSPHAAPISNASAAPVPALKIGEHIVRSGTSSVAIPVTVINPLVPPPKDGIMANNSHQPPIARPGSTASTSAGFGLGSSTNSTGSGSGSVSGSGGSSVPAAHTAPVAKPLDVALCKEDLVELGVIGRGQNGKVLRCLHVPSLSLVALKTMNIHEKGGRHQLLKELHAFSKLSSQYIIPFLGAFYDGGEIALASEYMDWGSLQHFVAKRNGPITSEPVLKYIMKQVCKGLQYLHQNCQIHRDIKPENILVNHKGYVKIADFGLLKELKDTFSTTDTYLGTMAYLSPERITSKHYSYSSDIWALGVSLIFCATGKPCYDSSDYWELVDMISNKPPPELTATAGQYSQEMLDFLACCVRLEPEKRLSATQLLNHPWLADVPTPRSIKCSAMSATPGTLNSDGTTAGTTTSAGGSGAVSGSSTGRTPVDARMFAAGATSRVGHNKQPSTEVLSNNGEYAMVNNSRGSMTASGSSFTTPSGSGSGSATVSVVGVGGSTTSSAANSFGPTLINTTGGASPPDSNNPHSTANTIAPASGVPTPSGAAGAVTSGAGSSVSASVTASPAGAIKVMVNAAGASAAAASAAATTTTTVSVTTPCGGASLSTPGSAASGQSLLSPAANVGSGGSTPSLPHTPAPTPIPMISVIGSPPDPVHLRLPPSSNPPELSLGASHIASPAPAPITSTPQTGGSLALHLTRLPSTDSPVPVFTTQGSSSDITPLDSKSAIPTGSRLALASCGCGPTSVRSPPTDTPSDGAGTTSAPATAGGSLTSPITGATPLSTLLHPLRVQAGADWPFGCYIAREHTDFDVIADIIIDRLFKLPDGSYRHNLEIDDARFERIADQLGVPIEDVEDGFADKLKARREAQSRAAAAGVAGVAGGSAKRNSGSLSANLSRSASADSVSLSSISAAAGCAPDSATSIYSGGTGGSGNSNLHSSPPMVGVPGGSWAVPPSDLGPGASKPPRHGGGGGALNALQSVTAQILAAPSPPQSSQPAPVLNEEGFAIVCTPEPDVGEGFNHESGESIPVTPDPGSATSSDGTHSPMPPPPQSASNRRRASAADDDSVKPVTALSIAAGSNPAAGLTLRSSAAGAVSTGTGGGVGAAGGSTSSPRAGSGGAAPVPYVTPIKKLGLTLHAHKPDQFNNLKNLPLEYNARMAALRASVTTPKESNHAVAATPTAQTPVIVTHPVVSGPPTTSHHSQYHQKDESDD